MTTFTWTIRNFDLCPNRWGRALKSPEFSLYSSHMPKFRLMLYPRGINRDTSDNLSLYIYKSNDDGEVNKVTYSCELGVVTSKGRRLSCQTFKNPLLKLNGEGSPKFISRETLAKDSNRFLSDGSLTVYCEIERLNNNETSARYIPTYGIRYGTNEHLTELSDAFNRLYESEQHCDLDLVTADKTFKVHKAILQARFPEFLEKVEGGSCSVEKVGTSTMDALLLYLYSGKLNKSQVNIFDLVKSACKIPPRLKSLLVQRIRNIQVSTSFTQKVLAFSWDIPNFSDLKSDKALQYTLMGDESCPWTWINLSLTASTADRGKRSFAFTIERYASECRRVICKIKVFDLSKTFEHTFEEENIWSLPVFLTEESLTKDGPLVLNEVSFHIEITLTDGTVANETDKIEFYPHKASRYDQLDDLKLFQQDLKNLLNDSKFSDVTLVSGNDKFPAHKFVLCARSSVFSEMFQNESLESNTVVTEFDPWVVKKMLSYIYCGDVGFTYASTKEIVGMHAAANKYCIPGLKGKCLNLLKSILRVENAGEILASAHDWDDRDLKEHVYEFVLSHPKEIASSEEWKAVMMRRSDVALETINKALSFISSEKS